MRSIYCAILVFVAATIGHAQDVALSDILIDGEEWKPFFKDCKSIGALAAVRSGSLYLLDPKKEDILKISPRGKLGPVDRKEVTALGFHDALLLAKLGDHHCNISGTSKGWFLVDREKGSVAYRGFEIESDLQEVADALKDPVGLVLWPGEGTLVVSEAHGDHLWTCRVEKDGGLASKDKYYTLRKPSGNAELTVGTMTVDSLGRLYCATSIGVQIFDPTGRMIGVLTKPKDAPVTHVALGGEKGNTLYIACGDEIFARQIQGKAVPWKEKVK